MKLSILNIVEDTTVDGPGFRTAIYCAGCPNACPGCHNPESWNIHNGKMMETDEILAYILEDEFANVTFSGGDPMFQADGFAELAQKIKANSSKNIWCYTGFRYENLLKRPGQAELLRWVDVLVDGRFMEALKNSDLLFRGSSNQRLIDVQQSLMKGKICLYQPESEFCRESFMP